MVLARWTDERVEAFIGNLLRWGVIVAATVGAVGGAYFLWTDGGLPANRHVFHGEKPWLTSVGGVIHGIAAGHSSSFVQLGILLLIATPIARVALSLVAFAKQRDSVYVVITAVVLSLLLFGLLGGGV